MELELPELEAVLRSPFFSSAAANDDYSKIRLCTTFDWMKETVAGVTINFPSFSALHGWIERQQQRSSLGFSTHAYKVLFSLAFLLLCSIITVPVTYSTSYSTSSRQRMAILYYKHSSRPKFIFNKAAMLVCILEVACLSILILRKCKHWCMG